MCNLRVHVHVLKMHHVHALLPMQEGSAEHACRLACERHSSVTPAHASYANGVHCCSWLHCGRACICPVR